MTISRQQPLLAQNPQESCGCEATEEGDLLAEVLTDEELQPVLQPCMRRQASIPAHRGA